MDPVRRNRNEMEGTESQDRRGAMMQVRKCLFGLRSTIKYSEIIYVAQPLFVFLTQPNGRTKKDSDIIYMVFGKQGL